MTKYSLRYKNDHAITEVENFNGDNAARAILLAQHHSEPAELWEDGRYVTTLRRSTGHGFWELYREPDVAQRCDP